MQITLTKEQVKEAFGELRFMGADNCYRYDKDSKKKTEEVEALKLHLGSMKLGNSVDIRLEKQRNFQRLSLMRWWGTGGTGICPLCAERELPCISGEDYL